MARPTSGAARRSPAGADLRLRPTERVQRPSEFQRVLRGGRCFRDPLARIHVLESRREMSRLGLVVSRKLGGAVARNRLKRLLRECFRKFKSRLPGPLDLVVVPDRRAGPKDLAAYGGLFERFLAWWSGLPARGAPPPRPVQKPPRPVQKSAGRRQDGGP